MIADSSFLTTRPQAAVQFLPCRLGCLLADMWTFLIHRQRVAPHLSQKPRTQRTSRVVSSASLILPALEAALSFLMDQPRLVWQTVQRFSLNCPPRLATLPWSLTAGMVTRLLGHLSA